jgi:hypothetical protein
MSFVKIPNWESSKFSFKRGHGPREDEIVKKKVHVSFIRKSFGDMIT